MLVFCVVCVLPIKLFFPTIDINNKHPKCPCRCFILNRQALWPSKLSNYVPWFHTYIRECPSALLISGILVPENRSAAALQLRKLWPPAQLCALLQTVRRNLMTSTTVCVFVPAYSCRCTYATTSSCEKSQPSVISYQVL